MASSRDDTATLIIAVLVILAMLGGGLVFVARRAAWMRALAAEQQARAAQIQAQVRAETARAEEESRRDVTSREDQAYPREESSTREQARLDLLKAGRLADYLSRSSADLGSFAGTVHDQLRWAEIKLQEPPLKDDPETANAHETLGQGFMSIGELDAAERQYSAALALRTKANAADSPEAAADRVSLAKIAAAKAR
jgi:hypothetical protein